MPTRGEMERDAALRQVPGVLDKIVTALGVQTQRDDDADTNIEQALARINAELSNVTATLDNITSDLALRNEIAKEQVRATMAHSAILLSTSAAAGGESIEFSDALTAVKTIMDEVRSYE